MRQYEYKLCYLYSNLRVTPADQPSLPSESLVELGLAGWKAVSSWFDANDNETYILLMREILRGA